MGIRNLEEQIKQQNSVIVELTATVGKLLASSLANIPLNAVNLNALQGGGIKMPRPLRYGQGSIKERKRINKKGSVYKWYEVRWYDEYGNRHTKTGATKEDARRELLQFNKRSMKNTKKNVKTFGEYMFEWYDTFGKAECGEVRNKLNLTQINRIPKEIMDKSIGCITASELQQYLNTIQQPHPKLQTKQLLTACIRYAFNSGHIKSNIGMLLKADIPKAPEKQILPREREKEFIESLPKQYCGYAIGLVYTGCRIGEFMRLNENWQTDIDYKNEIIKIRETKSLRQKDIRAGITYTIREIPLLPEVAKIEFPLPVVKKQTINKNFNKVNAKLCLEITPHCMRHTFISRCNELGITPSIIRNMVGHKTERMTMHYTHNTTDLVEREYRKLKINTPINTPFCAETDEKFA
jgi:integrase